MAKQLLLNALAKVLGEFIDINEENLDLSLAVWSGQIVLNNLKLKTDSFVRPFNLSILHGTISKLEINIPWTALLNSPVRIVIDGVNLQIEPLNMATMDKQEAKRRLLQNKMEKLKLAEKFFESSLDDGDATDGKGKPSSGPGDVNGQKTPGYLQQMTTKIIDNLEITLKNVHVRYQDSQSVPGTTFAAGITLSSFILATCDEQWRKTYVARSASQPTASMYKIAELHGLGIYWNTKADSFTDSNVEAWTAYMQSQIFRSDSRSENSHLTHLEYLLAPRNNLSVKMTHNDSIADVTSQKPKFSFVVESTSLPLAVDRLQLNQLSATLDTLGTMHRRRQPFTYRPLGRPTDPGNAQVWWRYACKLIVKKNIYLRLVRLSRMMSEVTGKDNLLSPAEKEEMRELEQRIPLHTLIIFRHEAAKEAAVNKARHAARLKQIPDTDLTVAHPQGPPDGSNGTKSWWFWDSSGGDISEAARSSPQQSASSGDDGDVPIASLLKRLGSENLSADSEAPATEQSSASSVLFELKLKTSSTIEVSSFGSPIIRAAMAVKIIATVSGLGISTQADLTDILVEDKFTPSPVIKNIIAVQHVNRRSNSVTVAGTLSSSSAAVSKGNDNGASPPVIPIVKMIAPAKPSFSVLFETNHGKSTVKITALPIVFSLNTLCIQEILAFVSPPRATADKSSSGLMHDDSNASAQAMMQAAANQAKRSHESSVFEVFFEAHAPKIIVPESNSPDTGLLLLDTGYLSVKGSMSISGMSWDVTLKEINAAMPLSVRDMYSFDEQLLYLIKPFDIVTKMQNIDKSVADMTVSVEITPEIRGELDSNKLARLLAVVQVISSTFSRPKMSTSTSASFAVMASGPLNSFTPAPLARSDSVSSRATVSKAPMSSSAGSYAVVDVGGMKIANVKSSPQSIRTDDDDVSLEYGTPEEGSRLAGGAVNSISSREHSPQTIQESVDNFASKTDIPELLRLITGKMDGSFSIPTINPMHQNMFITIKLPAAVLDLLYDPNGDGHHLVFELAEMDATFVSHPYDMGITFDMNSISIQDSLRSENQRYLARTPKGCRLVHIDYLNIFDDRSPLYREHGTEVLVNFSHLELDCDVNTVTHLKPFLEVLLAKKMPNQENVNNLSDNISSNNNRAENPISPDIGPKIDASVASSAINPSTWVRAMAGVSSPGSNLHISDVYNSRSVVAPTGMHIVLSLDKVSLNLLRTSSISKAGAQLDMAFSLQVSQLVADINMQALLYSDVKLRSFEIFDSREISKDYLYRTIFCPLFEDDDSSTLSTSEHLPPSPPLKEKFDLLHIVFHQETKNLTFIDIAVRNTTSFVAIDTILDFVNVFFANFFAILDLLASKPPTPSTSPQQEVNFKPIQAFPVGSNLDEPKNVKFSNTDFLTYIDSTTMNLSVRVDNPRLIVLDDPSVESSRSFVGRCGIEVHYTRECKTFLFPDGTVPAVDDGSNKELQESLHVSIRSLELSVQRDISSKHLQSLLEPLGVEFHLRRRSLLNGISLYNHMSIDIDGVDARLSLGDIMLAQSIMTRRLLVDPEVVKALNAARASASQKQQSGTSAVSPISSPGSIRPLASWFHQDDDSPNLSIAIHSGTFSLTAINDYNGQNVPLLRLLLEGSTFCADGYSSGKFVGEGSLVIAADIYNSKLSVWEPVLEKWKPTLVINALTGAAAAVVGPSLTCELKADHTLQLTLSGMMIEKVLDTISLFTVIMKNDNDVMPFYSGDAVPEIMVYNLLGDGMDLEMRECGSGNVLLTLPAGGTGQAQAVPKIIDVGVRKTWIHSAHMPSAVDIQFIGEFGKTRKPIHHLPFNICGSRLCNIQCNMKAVLPFLTEGKQIETAVDVKGELAGNMRQAVLEPLVEELYENARYDPITGRWRTPFLLGDPNQFTDASGTRTRVGGFDAVKLENADRWEWQGDWTVDTQGIIGEEIDDDGWEYSTNFSSFSIASKRRCALAMDCVRRRRWIRIRRPKASVIDEQLRPYSLFWDVSVLKNGSRQVYIRSGLQVQNGMPFPIDISFSYSAWPHDQICGPIGTGELFSVPLLFSYATSMMIRPAGGDSFTVYKWSSPIPCSIQQYDFKSSKDITCIVQRNLGSGSNSAKYNVSTFTQAHSSLSPSVAALSSKNDEEPNSNAGSSEGGQDTICIRVLSKQSKKCLVLNCVPYIVITNALPCELKFRCFSGDRRKEAGSLPSGSTSKLSYVNLSSAPKISVKVGKYGWSKNVMVRFPDDLSRDSTILYSLEMSVSGLGNQSHPLHPHAAMSAAPVGLTQKSSRETSVTPDAGLVLSMVVRYEEGNVLRIEVFSKWMLADRSGLNFSIWSQYKPGAALIKHTTGQGDELRWDAKSNANSNSPQRTPRSAAALTASLSSDTLSSISGNSNSGTGNSSRLPVLKRIPVDTKLTIRSFMSGKARKGLVDEEILANQIIYDLAVDSSNEFKVARLDVGSKVYTDRMTQWTHVPTPLQGSICIRTPAAERMSNSKQLMQFQLNCPAIVLLIIDLRIQTVPRWVTDEGYQIIIEKAIARKLEEGALHEFQYSIYGKYFDVQSIEDVIILKGNWNKNLGSMYSVAILPDPQFQIAKASAEESVLASRPPTVVMGRAASSSTQVNATSGSAVVAATKPAVSPSSLASSRITKEFQGILRQIMFTQKYDKASADRCWVDGGQHLTLFHAYDDTVSLGLAQGRVWSDDIAMNAVSQTKGFFEIVDWHSMKEYQLSYSISSLPGIFGLTQLLTVMPKYAIVNCIDEPIFIAQKGCVDKVSATSSGSNCLVVDPYSSENWHKFDTRLGNNIHIRSQSTHWSLASIDINEAGSSILHLPMQNALVGGISGSMSGNMIGDVGPYVIHVEVKEADPSEHCSVVIIIWRATVEGSTALSIHNDTNVPITIAQADVNFDAYEVDPSLYEICISPGQWIPFGWADPEASTDVMVVVGTTLCGSKKRIATIDMMQKTGELLRLPDNSGRSGPSGEVLLSLAAREGGRVLRLTRMTQYSDEAASLVVDDSTGTDPSNQAMNFYFSCSLASLGVSLVLDKPTRREFLSLYADGLQADFRKEELMKSIEFKLMDIQIDNYSETFIYPVMLHSTKKEIHKSVTSTGDYYEEDGGDQFGDDFAEDENGTTTKASFIGAGGSGTAVDLVEVPLLQVTIIQEISRETASSVFPYIAVRMLPLAVEVDSATLQLLYNDFIVDLKLASSVQIQAIQEPTTWIDNFNRSMLSPQQQLQHVDVYRAQMVTQASKMYFERLVIHPIKFVLTYVQVPYPRKEGPETIRSTMVNALTTLAAVEKMKIKLKSFEVENAMETKTSLINHITNKSLQDLQSQLAQIAGSLAVLGSPMGFARKVGSGVKAFFYEPYQGAVHSPHEFIIGIGKGTSSLISGVVTGAMNSTVAFVGTASKGISYLSGDSEYVRKRAMKRQRNRAAGGGIMDGIINGGESIVSGLTSGMSGLLTKPFEEASKTGALGFIRGIGLGLIGAAVKPVMGITDGITSVATGISNSVGEAVIHAHVRPARALDRSPYDNTELVIHSLNLDAAFAQDFIVRRAKANNYQDAFLCYIPMGPVDNHHKHQHFASVSHEPGEAIILSEVYVYWRKAKSLWGRTWANISHCIILRDAVGLMLYAGAGFGANGKPNNRPETVSIPCGSRSRALKVYAALAQNADRMGNPSLVVPIDMLDQRTMVPTAGLSNQSASAFFAEESAKQGRAVSLAGELEGYRFGSVNGKKFSQITGPEIDVLQRAEHYLSQRYTSLVELDERVWKLIWEWECTHMGLQATRCCGTVILNRSDSPIQIGRVQIVHGCNISIYGSNATNYEADSRCIQPMGSVVIFIWAFSPSPIEIGHLKANINTVAFDATVASTQRESSCKSRGGFSVGFLEKTVSEWWSKYVILID